MAKDLISSLSTVGTTKIKKKKNITIKLFDKNGLPTINPSLAYKTFILVTNDVVSTDVSKDADTPTNSEKKAISVYGYEVETEGVFKSIEFNEDEPLDGIIPYLYKMTYLDLNIQGTEGNSFVSSDLMSAFFQKFSCININNKSYAPIYLPSGDIRLESLSISGGDIVIPESISFEADDSISLESIAFYTTTDEKVELNLLCKKVNVYNIKTSSYLAIKVIAGKEASTNDYMEGEVSFNSVTYNIEADDNGGYPEVKTDPLISISNIYKVKLSDIHVYGAQEYKAIKLHKINTVMMSGIDRISDKGVYGYTIGLSDVMTTYITNLAIEAGLKIEREVYGIFIADDGLAYNQKLVVSDFSIKNIRLINLGASKANSISFSNGQISTNHLLEAKETNSTKSLKFSECDMSLTEPISFYGDEVSFNNCKIKLLNSEKEENSHFAYVETSLVFDNTVLYGEIPFKFEAGTDAYIRFNECDVSLDKIIALYDSESNKDVKQLSVVDESNRVLYFVKTNVVANEISVDGMYRISTDSTSFNSDKINIRNTKVEFDPVIIVKPSGVTYNFENVYFKNSNIETRESHSSKMIATNTTGTLTYKVADNLTSEDIIKLDTTLSGSKINIKIDSEGASVNALVNSSNSIGSTVFGLNTCVTVSPSMKSEDITSFNQITEYQDRSSDSVNYGSSEEELSPYSQFGLNV